MCIRDSIKRAKVFVKDAKNNFKNKDFDVCMFHLEQAAQLLIKAKLLDLKGVFPRTHSLRLLLLELKKEGFKQTELEEFVEKNKKVLRNLERAYISSRYMYEEFFEDEVKDAFRVVRELEGLLWKD